MHRSFVLATAALLAGTVPAVAGAPDTSPPRLVSVSFSRTSVAVSGLTLVPVRIQLRLTDTSGVAENATGMGPSPQITLGPVPGFQERLHPRLALTSGTARDGVWGATVNVPSTWDGVVRITSVDAVDTAGNELSVRPADAALRVIGTHRPALTLTYTLLPGGGFRIHGRAYFTDTGRPLAGQPLAVAYDSGCDLEGGAADSIVTDARGRYEQRWDNGEPGAAGCAALTGAAAPGQFRTLLAYRLGVTRPGDSAATQEKLVGEN